MLVKRLCGNEKYFYEIKISQFGREFREDVDEKVAYLISISVDDHQLCKIIFIYLGSRFSMVI